MPAVAGVSGMYDLMADDEDDEDGDEFSEEDIEPPYSHRSACQTACSVLPSSLVDTSTHAPPVQAASAFVDPTTAPLPRVPSRSLAWSRWLLVWSIVT